ncbi:MAG TPA: response regulator, partial [Nocardioides sp.]
MSNSVLVVEDQEDIAAPLVRTLQREGYDVTWVDSGKKALELLAPPYDAELVLLDLGLPDMDGLEV